MDNNAQIKQPTKDRGVHKFDQGSVFSVLLKTALPIVILMLFNSTYAFVDSLMSSNYVDYGNVYNGGTVIGLVFPLMGVLIAFEVMVAVGVGLAYTQSMAQKDYVGAQQRHNESVTMILYIGIIVVIFMTIIGYPYLMTVSGNWGHNPNWGEYSQWKDMIWDGYWYSVILTISFIPMQILQSYIRVLRAEGKGDAAALIPILTLPINIFFDWLLMDKVNLGIKGAGIATLIANVIGLIMMWLYVWSQGLKDKLNIKLALPPIRLHKEIVTVILIFAMGSLLRRLFDNLTVMTMTTYIGNMNVDNSIINSNAMWDSSWTVMTRSINLGTQLSLGIAQAMSMLISYFVNSNQKEKIGETITYGAISMVIATFIASILLIGLQGLLFNSYHTYDEISGKFKFLDPISISFMLALIYSIPLSLQPMAVMFYAGTKNPAHTLQHSLVYNAIVILFASVGLIINLQSGHPIYLFVFVTIGAYLGFLVVMFMFKYRYKQFIISQ